MLKRGRLLAILSGLFCLSCITVSQRQIAPLAPRMRTVNFHGWRECAELSNGLVSLTLAPCIGGRAIQFKLGRQGFFFLSRKELGRVYRDERFREYHFFGGSYLQLHPEQRWASSGGGLKGVLLSTYPPDLYMGSYRVSAPEVSPLGVAVELFGPYARVRERRTGREVLIRGDPAAGVFVRKRFKLSPYSTRATIRCSIRNVSSKPQLWGAWEVTQLRGRADGRGSLSRSQRADGSSWVYLPINPESRFEGGFLDFLSGQPAGESARRQWMPGLVPNILAVQYLGRFGKIGVDAPTPWAAFADQRNQLVFVVRTSKLEGRYPDGGCTVEVLTHGGSAAYPLLEIHLFGPARVLKPGEESLFEFEWAATTSLTPIRAVSALGVISEPLQLLQRPAGWFLKGAFGVFYWARARIVFLDQRNTTIGRLNAGLATPFKPFVLDCPVDIPVGTRAVTVSLYSLTGAKLGDLSRVELPF